MPRPQLHLMLTPVLLPRPELEMSLDTLGNVARGMALHLDATHMDTLVPVPVSYIQRWRDCLDHLSAWLSTWEIDV